MLQLKCFGLYFKGILNRKWLLSHRNNDISYRDAREFGGIYAPRENFEKINAISLSLKRVPLLIIKHFDFSYTLVGYSLAMGYFAHREILEDMLQLMRFYHILHKNSIAWSLMYNYPLPVYFTGRTPSDICMITDI